MLSKGSIKEEVKESLKKGESIVVMTLRSLLSEIEKKEIELGKKDEGLTEEEMEKVAMGELKKRNEAIEQYEKAGRDDLAEDEKKEAEILGKYVPEKMSDEELESVVDGIIKEKNPSGMQDMGAVMSGVMAKVGNKADGSKVSEMVKQKLQNA
ncbi:MAG: hypothetical protein A2919_01580 [Candidatus Spechtbacteria bacterium RIFCSPLOWO2_01_FULL_43_12]|uniref:Glutamyl-tRNA amidotransferase n=1 Tax=Candidatus Spechtbacteria bacterium RIFCSPLOWO2_01_FULL_43_12 TaxID=1802162 RepID=A0A1G2HFQ8_9BACT|nr:MAG: hypothetical protein A2919_01580 [Candidatus Spechtbacteria bacterium RIFCSPLOWO2_01_FULL_43_12]